ncbi:MAG TPA: DUF885 domain-containing protein [Candidatus Polarisedimenticolia bacterium]|jgi:uncharacterized protein (DUF885 family)|nr:DUF885 domain-containing protein [Candidatus Polarisedimenticolia bacterium]
MSRLPVARITALALLLVPLPLASCARKAPPPPRFQALREEYFVGFLQRNPVTSTYLGGDAYNPRLSRTLRTLRDYSEAGISDEVAFYRKIAAELGSVPLDSLSAAEKIDCAVMKSQLEFLLHQTVDRKYHRRSLDTYVVEPFRAVDWQMQQMTDLGGGNYGTEEEWRALGERLDRIPRYLDQALENLRSGVAAGDFPDHRMIETDGIKAAQANAEYFEKKLPEQVKTYLSGQPYQEAIESLVGPQALEAASAYADFAHELSQMFVDRQDGDQLVFKEAFRADRYALGEKEYDWAVAHNLRVDKTARELFDDAAGKVAETQALMARTARRIGEKRRLTLDFSNPTAERAAVRKVMDLLSGDFPRSDEEMFKGYREKALQLVEFARQKGMFDLPADYRLDIVETPPVLRDSVDAAYYPAPPFKKTGVGRFYLTPTGNDAGRLKENNYHAMADLCAHEGFPGHDWYYQFMRPRSASISPIRWLTPGAVEDSSSMWEDSISAEGWALYAEALMAEPQPGAPDGFYTPEERLYQLQGQLLRDARVRLDTGLHTGRLTFDEAVDYYTENVDFLPHACRAPKEDDVRRASCDTARRAIYRYSKWPTQAITYRLGKSAIQDLRAAAQKAGGAKFSPREFHERFLMQGSIPPGYFAAAFLEEAR